MYFNDDLYRVILKYKGKYRGNLEDYLKNVYREVEELDEYIKDNEKEVNVSDELFLRILEEGFRGDRYCGCSKGFEKEPVKDHYPKCKYKGFCGTICDEIADEKEEKAYKKVKLKKGEYGLYKVKRTLEELIDTTSELSSADKQDPFTFLENIIISNEDYIDEYSSEQVGMRGSKDDKKVEWVDFVILLKGGWNFKRGKKGYNFGVYKIITYVIAALIVIPYMMNDKLMSPIRVIKYFGMIAIIYLVVCYVSRLVTLVVQTQLSHNFKVSRIELIVHLIIIIIAFIL
ncbi:hypothetical protein [Oceanirhabdus sp. W0125-5]|uniref:hypothetical protein n=1 Tax=Oceanirhabdus sp. W0125-5 TaxID=2999116 RepID=UPI0022F3263F|nr:hypothetical protein [Oceanirhabdus sp. W0125-5]WBW98327.1 hypothetical protein OW730_06035 [Oceanirhabdus sp. W0125-5]